MYAAEWSCYHDPLSLIPGSDDLSRCLDNPLVSSLLCSLFSFLVIFIPESPFQVAGVQELPHMYADEGSAAETAETRGHARALGVSDSPNINPQNQRLKSTLEINQNQPQNQP